ncbi:hypothetical protein AVEN_22097-1, partial [Araneus ventricosus]
GLDALPLVWCYATHPDPAYPTGFKALKSRRGRELTGVVRKFGEGSASSGVVLVI